MRRCIASPLSPCNLARSGSAFALSLSPSPASSPLLKGGCGTTTTQVAHSSTKGGRATTPKKKSGVKKGNSMSTPPPGKTAAQLKIETPTPTFSSASRQELEGLLDGLVSPSTSSVLTHPSSHHMPASPITPAIRGDAADEITPTALPKKKELRGSPRRQVQSTTPSPKKNTTSSQNTTVRILDDFVSNLNAAVPKADVATRLRIALFEEREFLFIAEPSVVSNTATAAEEEAAQQQEQQQASSTPTRSSHTVEEVGEGMIRVSLNKIIAEELNLNLPPQLLLEGNESPEEAEFLLAAKEKEITIKSHLTKELKAQGFSIEEVVDSLDALDARMEAQLMENIRNKTQGLGDSNFQPGETKSMEEFAAEAMNDFTQAKAAMVEQQGDNSMTPPTTQSSSSANQSEPQQQQMASEVPSELEAEVERLQNDYNKIFEAQRPRLFMNFLQRGSYEKESNSAERRVVGNNFIDQLEAQQLEEAAEVQQPEQKSTTITVSKTSKKKGTSSAHAKNLVGAEVDTSAEEEEEVTQHFEIQTEVDTDLLGLNEQRMKFFVNDGKSVALVADGAGSSANNTTTSSFSEEERDQILARAVKKSVEAGVSLVALGVRLQNKRPETQVKNSIEDRLISSHAYVLEGSKVAQMKKRANDLYHPLLLATCSQPSSAPPTNALE